jgi:hypothetical protein
MAKRDLGDPPLRLKQLSTARVSQDGETVFFRIETTNGEMADLECGTEEVGDIIGFLCQLAEAAGKHRDHDDKPSKAPRNYLVPVPATGFGFATTEDDLAKAFPDLAEEELANRQALLLLRLGGFDLSFRMADMKLGDVPLYLRESADQIEESIR